VSLVDTAGLRDHPGRLEALGIERTLSALAGCDVAVLVVPPGATEAEASSWRAKAGVFHVEHGRPPPRLVEVLSKADLGEPTHRVGQVLAVSGHTGEGVEALRARLAQVLGARGAGAVAVTSERHLDALRRAHEAVARATVALEHSTLEVVAGEVGIALAALAEVTGEDVSAELVEAIFRRFCVGK